MSDDYGPFGYDKDGYDKDGYDVNGFNRKGINKDTGTNFDTRGYNKNGYDKEGYNKDGFNKEGYDKYNCNRTGYDENGYDKIPNPSGIPIKISPSYFGWTFPLPKVFQTKPEEVLYWKRTPVSWQNRGEVRKKMEKINRNCFTWFLKSN